MPKNKNLIQERMAHIKDTITPEKHNVLMERFSEKINKAIDALGDEVNGFIIVNAPFETETLGAAFFANTYDMDINSGIPIAKLDMMSKNHALTQLNAILDSVLGITKSLEELQQRYFILAQDIGREIFKRGGNL